MKILILYDFPIKGGGSGYYAKYLGVRLLEMNKHKIAFVLPDKNQIDPRFKQYIVPIKQPPVFISRPGLEKSKKYSDLTSEEIAQHYNAYIKTTIKAVEDFKPDVIHVHHLGINAWTARYINAIYRINYVITSHGSCLLNIINDKRYYRLSNDALRAATYVTTVSGDNRYRLVKTFNSDLSKKLRTIPGGVRLSLFPEHHKRSDLEKVRQDYNLPEKPLVLFCGRLINEKGVQYLIHAAEKIKANVIIAGDGNEKKEYKKIIKDLHLKNVKLVGYVDHDTLIKFYYLADVFVAPSVWDDPMPLTIIEAMAAKCPLVVTKKGGIPLAVKNNYNGLFVRPKSSNEIAEKVNYLLGNEQLRKKMGERSRQLVIKKFTWSIIAGRFDNLFKKII